MKFFCETRSIEEKFKMKIRYAGINIVIFSALAIYGIFCSGCSREIPINEKPMYGNITFTSEQQKANEQFIKELVMAWGDRETACKETIAEVYRYGDKGDLKTAMKRANQAWLLDPNNADVYNVFGHLLYKQGKRDEAIKFYEKAVAINPQNPSIMCNLASQYIDKASRLSQKYKKEEYVDKALNLCEKASQLATTKSDLSYIYYAWAGALFVQKDYLGSWVKIKISRKYGGEYIQPEMIKELSRFMPEPEADVDLPKRPAQEVAIAEKPAETKPDESRVYYDAAVSYAKKEQNDEAILNYTKTIEINPKYAAAYFDRGVIYGMKGLLDEAISDFTKVIELTPDNADAYNNRGYSYFKKSMYNEAISDVDNAIRLKPHEADFYFAKAGACDNAGRLAEAKEAYKKFLKIAPYGNEQKVNYAKERIKQIAEKSQ